jgi:hypothetical protein
MINRSSWKRILFPTGEFPPSFCCEFSSFPPLPGRKSVQKYFSSFISLVEDTCKMPIYDDDSNDGLLTEECSTWKDDDFQRQLRYTRAVVIPWILALFFFCTTCLFAWQSRATPVFEGSRTASYNGTYETGYSTDFGIYSPL